MACQRRRAAAERQPRRAGDVANDYHAAHTMFLLTELRAEMNPAAEPVTSNSQDSSRRPSCPERFRIDGVLPRCQSLALRSIIRTLSSVKEPVVVRRFGVE